MQNKVTVQLKGTKEIINALRKLDVKATEALFDTLMDASEITRADAAKRASSINTTVAQNVIKEPTFYKGEGFVTIGLNKKGSLGIVFELGADPHNITLENAKALTDGKQFSTKAPHPGITAQPFLRPAIDTTKEQVVKEFGNLLKERLGLD